MMLSVVIPNFNKSKYLETCVASIMTQTLLPDEIWIVDDCSTDDSREIIEKIRSENDRVRTIFFSENRGVSAARNAGIRAATTEYVTTLDSDDFLFDRNKLQREMECIRVAEARGKKNVYAYSGTVYVDEQGNVLPGHEHTAREYLRGKITVPLLAGYHFRDTTPRDYCIRKSYMIEAGLYDESSRYFEDLDLLLRVSEKCEALYSGGAGVGYRYVPGGLSHQSRERFKTTMRAIVRKYSERFTPRDKLAFWSYLVMGVFRKAIRKARRAVEKLLLGKV